MWITDLARDISEERVRLRKERIDFVRSLLAPPKSKAEIEEEDKMGRADEFLKKTREESEPKGLMEKEEYGVKYHVVIA